MQYYVIQKKYVYQLKKHFVKHEFKLTSCINTTLICVTKCWSAGKESSLRCFFSVSAPELCVSMKGATRLQFNLFLLMIITLLFSWLHWMCCEHICPRRHLLSSLTAVTNHEREDAACPTPELYLSAGPCVFQKTTRSAGFVDFQSQSWGSVRSEASSLLQPSRPCFLSGLAAADKPLKGLSARSNGWVVLQRTRGVR